MKPQNLALNDLIKVDVPLNLIIQSNHIYNSIYNETTKFGIKWPDKGWLIKVDVPLNLIIQSNHIYNSIYNETTKFAIKWSNKGWYTVKLSYTIESNPRLNKVRVERW